ncbi:hypothetical protein JDV02_002181 [Purpureocillium takamizusanense]|uniref:DUF7029 domain-containing protein n=1 Tax=Purpureocillium takamizusanense TaxID=2060973 RepID=A0A9Q8Q9T2_9HYPO|nr:uncharacterized protein JDV02_002181 [Purpureocillium takamizusanense]UNI15670.1 hypothetical protein JDV02_002181 [Purpureocillium takamizusanense]
MGRIMLLEALVGLLAAAASVAALPTQDAHVQPTLSPSLSSSSSSSSSSSISSSDVTTTDSRTMPSLSVASTRSPTPHTSVGRLSYPHRYSNSTSSVTVASVTVTSTKTVCKSRRPRKTKTKTTTITAATATRTATFYSAAPTKTLTPNVHWKHDTKKVTNVIPIPDSKGSELYYGPPDQSKKGPFAFIKYNFTLPSVNLDHSAHVKVEYDQKSGLRVTFTKEDAFRHASETWNPTDEGLVLIAYAEGCQAYKSGERCFFNATSLAVNHQDMTIDVSCKAHKPDDLIHSAEARWGMWEPSEALGPKSGKPLGQCKAAADEASRAFLQHISPDRSLKCAHGLHSRSVWSWIGTNVIAPVVDAAKGIIKGLSLDREFDKTFDFKLPNVEEKDGSENGPKVVDGIAENKPKAVEGTVENKAKDVGGSGEDNEKEANGGESKAADLVDASTKKAVSPWGNAILLDAIGPEESPYLSLYCVDCGVTGSAKLAGHLQWVPFKGFTKGEIGLHVVAKAGLKVGIDARYTFQKDVTHELCDVGLPALSFGVVTIGPSVSLGVHANLTAQASGQLLAGAEVGLQDAYVVLDLVNRTRNSVGGWKPYFKPVFQAHGEVMVEASLGLPMGIHCGVKVESLEERVSFIDEPSIILDARGAVHAELNADGTIDAGFNNTDGCRGISARLSWRNKLEADVPFMKMKYTLADTGAEPLTKFCLGRSGKTLQRRAIGHVPRPMNATSSSVSLGWVKTEPEQPFIDGNGLELGALMNPDRTVKVLSCGDGNMYAVRSNDTHSGCSDQWATQPDNTVVSDGARRMMYYSNDTMSELGVSKLGVGKCDDLPDDGDAPVWTALVAYHDETTTTATTTTTTPTRYIAADPYKRVFYPIVCNFSNKNGSQVFLVDQPGKGIERMQSNRDIDAVTSFKVSECRALVLSPGRQERSCTP